MSKDVRRLAQGDPVKVDQLVENSMKVLEDKKTHIIDIKTRSQGVVLSVAFRDIERVQVKLISSDLIDQVYYDLEGSFLQMLLQEKYKPYAENVNYNAIIPFSLVGNLPLNDDSYIQLTVELREADQLGYDRIISAFDASNPLIAKRYDEIDEFDTNSYDELFFLKSSGDVSYNYQGRRVHLPQLLFMNEYQVHGFSSLKVIQDTLYTFSAPVYLIAVEY